MEAIAREMTADSQAQNYLLEKVQSRLFSNGTSLKREVTKAKSKADGLYQKAKDNFTKLAEMEVKMKKYDVELATLLNKISKLGDKLDELTTKEGGIMTSETFHRKCSV